MIGKAKLDILTLNTGRTIADCSTSWPAWLLPLLGA